MMPQGAARQTARVDLGALLPALPGLRGTVVVARAPDGAGADAARPHERDRALAHALARRLVAETTGRPAPPLAHHCPTCGSTDHGRPSVPGEPELHVSLAHAGGWVAAVVADAPCGVDVEPVRPLDVPPVALTPGEQAALTAADPSGRSALFLAWWTRKEAAAKAGLLHIDDFATYDARTPRAHVADVPVVPAGAPGAAVAAVALRR